MKMVVAILVALFTCSAAFAADIVTVPTANQLKGGEFEVAYYNLRLDLPPQAPQYLQAECVYWGVSDRLELDMQAYQPQPGRDIDSAVVIANVLVLKETAALPAVVIGGRNLGMARTTGNPTVDSTRPSWFICTAKNITPMTAQGPKLPLIRLHLSAGTPDYTLLGEERHNSVFGGIQVLLTPKLGVAAMYDDQDAISAVTYTPWKPGPTFKAGTYGHHWWTGIAYTITL